MKDPQKIGIFGGTFNPIHNGHLKMAEAARKEYKLSCVYFIPSGNPPHKSKEKLLSAKIRFALVQKAIKNKKYFKILDIEIKKRKPCYTIDTIRKLSVGIDRDQYLRLYFLIGQDAFEKLHTWKDSEKLAKMVIFLVFPRKKIKTPKIKGLKWQMVHTKPVNISGREIRKKIHDYKFVSKLIPKEIKNFLNSYK